MRSSGSRRPVEPREHAPDRGADDRAQPDGCRQPAGPVVMAEVADRVGQGIDRSTPGSRRSGRCRRRPSIATGPGSRRCTSQMTAAATIVAIAVATTVHSQRRWIPRTPALPSKPAMMPTELSLTPSAKAIASPAAIPHRRGFAGPLRNSEDGRDRKRQGHHRFEAGQASVEHRQRRGHRRRPREHRPDGPERAPQPEPDHQSDPDGRGHRDAAAPGRGRRRARRTRRPR